MQGYRRPRSRSGARPKPLLPRRYWARCRRAARRRRGSGPSDGSDRRPRPPRRRPRRASSCGAPPPPVALGRRQREGAVMPVRCERALRRRSSACAPSGRAPVRACAAEARHRAAPLARRAAEVSTSAVLRLRSGNRAAGVEHPLHVGRLEPGRSEHASTASV